MGGKIYVVVRVKGPDWVIEIGKEDMTLAYDDVNGKTQNISITGKVGG